VATSRESELQAIADRFADAAGEDIREALARSVGRFTDEHPGLDGERLAAFGAATERAIAAAADEISARLRDLDLWTSPRVRLAEEPELDEGGGSSLIERLLGGLTLHATRPPRTGSIRS